MGRGLVPLSAAAAQLGRRPAVLHGAGAPAFGSGPPGTGTMLALFGCPYLDTVRAAYDEATPLASGWRARIPLHQLFPLLVHVVLFGRRYAGRAVAAAWAALDAA